MSGSGNRVAGAKESAMGWLKLWWRQSDHYERLSAHLQARGMDTLTRATISLIGVALALVSVGTIWSGTGPRGFVQVGCALAGGSGALIATLLWLLRWPTRAQAVRYAVLCNASIALAALAQHEPNAAMLACTTFATLAGYIALFHTAPLMAYNFTIAGVVGAVEGIRVAAQFNIVAALSAYALLLLLNLAVPFGIQVIVHVLGTDAVRAEHDQLTGLLTRHAFQRRGKARLEKCREQRAHFVITVIDLDRFKELNDNYGHSTGDDALVSVANALRDTNDDTAVIGRSGGEEFVVADIWHPDDVNRRAQQLCDVIAALPFGITASVGTAGLHPAYRPGEGGDFILLELVAAADAAMYSAKRRGGNQAGHHEWPLPPPLELFIEDETDSRSDGLSA
jgi:diguanylate cyclase (GGDEF)-like protein